MSYGATHWVRNLPRGTMTPAQRFILTILADMAAEEDMGSYPTVTYLMRVTEMGERTIRNAVKDLVEMGHLRKEQRYRANGSKSSNRYYVTGFKSDAELDDPAGAAPPQVQERHLGQVQERHLQEEAPREVITTSSKELDTHAAKQVSSKSRRRKSAGPLPDSWAPTSEHGTYAQEQGYDLAKEVDSFKADALAQDRRYIEWNAAFARWLRTPYVHHKLGNGLPRSKRERQAAEMAKLIEQAAERDRQEREKK